MTQKTNISALTEVAIKAAIKAGKEILDVYHNSDFGVEFKSDNSPLTIADRRAHNIITEVLKETEIPVLSEEGKTIPYDERKNWKLFWLVDPLDGTKEFVKRNDEFTVNIALIESNSPI
ncbi:MAG: inositol monophosphatase family protein, partial [Draconibacterium sp.]|nr:inositol monophosphatase family protein [Draconibacterium sp.]